MQSSKSKPKSSTTNIINTAGLVIGIVLTILFHAGAAKLSYDKYGSIGWAILAFIFGSIYYPYYAFFVSGPSTSMFGAMRKLRR
jgi:hypothetical protein